MSEKNEKQLESVESVQSVDWKGRKGTDERICGKDAFCDCSESEKE